MPPEATGGSLDVFPHAHRLQVAQHPETVLNCDIRTSGHEDRYRSSDLKPASKRITDLPELARHLSEC
jgi:hypothetical protein